MPTRFKEINPATNKVWKLAEMHAALIESQAERIEWETKALSYGRQINSLCIKHDLEELTLQDVHKRFIMPRVRRDLVERPLFFKDARCGYQSLVQWVKEGYTELRKPLFN